MLKSFFNRNKDGEASNISEIGLTSANPILMSSIPSSYSFLNALCTISEGLSYERIGSLQAEKFSKLLDKYTFTLKNNNNGVMINAAQLPLQTTSLTLVYR